MRGKSTGVTPERIITFQTRLAWGLFDAALDIGPHENHRRIVVNPSRAAIPHDSWRKTRRARATALAGWLFLLALAPMGRAADDLAGRYFIAESVPADGGIPYGGTVDITARRSPVYVFNSRLDSGKRSRGLGLRDGNDLLGFSINTGGIAHGVAIYHREDNGRRWRARWISSIDGGGLVGEISFSNGEGQPLAGRHSFSGSRPRAGSFEGTVTITPRGEGVLLNFTASGGIALYRGVGVLCGEDRLAVGWSFGGTPSIAVYQVNDKGGLTGRRLSLTRSREGTAAGTERLAREGSEEPIFPPRLPIPGQDSPALPPAADELPVPAPAVNGGGGAGDGASSMLMAAPGSAPDVRTLTYAELMRRYGQRGQAERLLSEQLSAEERQRLETALQRRRTRGAKKTAPGEKTIAQLLEESRARVRRR
jgi:hypothetical protein